MSTESVPSIVDIFPDAEAPNVRIKKTTWRPFYLLVLPSADARGMLVVRGEQSECDYTRNYQGSGTLRLPHAVPLDSKTSTMLHVQCRGDLEVVRSLESGTVTVFAATEVELTPERAAEYSAVCGFNATPHPVIGVPPIEFNMLMRMHRKEMERAASGGQPVIETAGTSAQ
jgi:hypothetical protein